MKNTLISLAILVLIVLATALVAQDTLERKAACKGTWDEQTEVCR